MKKMLLAALFAVAVFVCLSMGKGYAEETAQERKIPHGSPTRERIQIPSAEALGNGKFRLGNITVDTVAKEVLIPGKLNMREGVIEFIASMKGGFKLYESILELDANAYEFNLSLILIGLDQEKGKTSAYHFDKASPEGDPVEIWVEWSDGSKKIVHRAEDLVFDSNHKKTMPHTNWVYTGSKVLEDGSYMAQMDGVLISFVHDPAAIIDNPSDFGLTQYGMLVVNKDMAPPVGTNILLKVKSLKKGK